jgi:FAD/FMN-containing dehydrogenase
MSAPNLQLFRRLLRVAQTSKPQNPLHHQLRRSEESSRTFHTTSPRPQRARVAQTAEKYPSLTRDSRFAQIIPEHVEYFKSVLGDAGIIDGVTTDATSDLEAFNCDWMNKYKGQTQLVLRPKTTKEVSQVLRYCHDNTLAVVPQGGNTGLVGGSVPIFDEVIISLTQMNRIRGFNERDGILTVDAGVILEVADNFLAEHQHIFPLDLGAKGSCHIGGNVATNAGGLRLLRYGSLHGTVLGIEAVLPNGTIINDLSQLRKNNTGYDIKQLFIGAEGTTGIITGVSIICPQRPKAVNVVFIGLESYTRVQQAYKEAKHYLGEILSAFELMDSLSQDVVHCTTRNSPPLKGKYPFYCLIETSGSNTEHDSEKLEIFLDFLISEGIAQDGVQAQDETQIQSLWAWREGIAEALGHYGKTYKYDLSIPQDHLYEVVESTQKLLSEKGLVGSTNLYPVIGTLGYGHVGDSNIHLNVVVRDYDKQVEDAIEPWVYEWIRQHHGSISAEHGLGFAKKPYIGYSRNQASLDLMKQIKTMCDPKGIMNPYKFI